MYDSRSQQVDDFVWLFASYSHSVRVALLTVSGHSLWKQSTTTLISLYVPLWLLPLNYCAVRLLDADGRASSSGLGSCPKVGADVALSEKAASPPTMGTDSPKTDESPYKPSWVVDR